MKKSIIGLVSFLIVSILVSCQGPQGEPGQPGKDGATIQTVVINVNQEHWGYSNAANNNYFVATVEMPEITEAVFDYGIVKMYRVYDFDKTTATQIEMPYVRHKEVNVGDNQWAFYTETVDYDYGIGSMNIYYTQSDFDYEIDTTFVPEAMQFRCAILYNK